MATAQELGQLTDHIRKTLPKQFLSEMEPNEQGGFVQFTWYSRRYIAKPNLEAWELKDTFLLVTGTSMLMQAALNTKDRNGKTVGAVIRTIQEAEDNMRGDTHKGLALLEAAKKPLLRLAGKSPSTAPKPQLAAATL